MFRKLIVGKGKFVAVHGMKGCSESSLTAVLTINPVSELGWVVNAPAPPLPPVPMDRKLGGHFGKEKNTNEKRHPHFVLYTFSPGPYSCRGKGGESLCIVTFAHILQFVQFHLRLFNNTFLTAHAVLYIARLEVDWIVRKRSWPDFRYCSTCAWV
jgi:hypothetical protein